MWYFTWILGLGLALGFGIINVLWLESSYAFGHLDEDVVRDRFMSRSRSKKR
jgi:cytochrome bd-I ubiquinol oxidase subunit X